MNLLQLRSTAYRAAAAASLCGLVSAQIRVTEFMYSGSDGEFIELTNVGATAVDLTGWSLDDQTAMPGAYDLSPAGVLAAGACVVVTDRLAVNFEANWGLSGVVVLGANAFSLFGRNDEIHVFDALGATVDLLAYGDQDFVGSHRAQNISAQGCAEALGVNDIYRWTGAVVGDAWMSVMSVNGDVGSPGTFVSVACPSIGLTYCPGVPNSTSFPATLDIDGSPSIAFNDVSLLCSGMPLNSVGYFLTSQTADLVQNPGGSSGTLCLGGSIGRYSALAQNSGATGSIGLTVDLTAISQPAGPTAAVSGETWRFQCWYRDSVLGFPTSSFSDGVEVTFY